MVGPPSFLPAICVFCDSAVAPFNAAEIGRRIVEFEQDGEVRAEYGKRIVELLSSDLTKRFGYGFSSGNLWYMKDFFLNWRSLQTPSAESDPALKDSKTLVRTDQRLHTLPGKPDLRCCRFQGQVTHLF